MCISVYRLSLGFSHAVYVHRAAFLDALVGLVNPSSTHFSKRCTSTSNSPTAPGRLLVRFADGTSHETDAVIGADGLKSVVRDFVVAQDSAARGSAIAFSNTAIYRGLIPLAELQAAGFKTKLTNRPACYLGPSKVRTSPSAHTVSFGAPADAWFPDVP